MALKPILPGGFVETGGSGGGGSAPPFSLAESAMLAAFADEPTRNYALDNNGRPSMYVDSAAFSWDNNDNPQLVPKSGGASFGFDSNNNFQVINSGTGLNFGIDGNNNSFLQSSAGSNYLFFFDNMARPAVCVMGASGTYAFAFDVNSFPYLQGANNSKYGFDGSGYISIASPGQGTVVIPLPTADPHNVGQWWSNLGIVTVSAG